MTPTRLMILGVLRSRQPTHGYEVRRELESWGAQDWANIAYRSIYHALSKMAEEGLLEPVDTGQVMGRCPVLPIPRDQVTTQPSLVARMVEALELFFCPRKEGR